MTDESVGPVGQEVLKKEPLRVEAGKLKEVFGGKDVEWVGPPKKDGSPHYEGGGEEMINEAVERLFTEEGSREEILEFVRDLEGFTWEMFRRATETGQKKELSYHNASDRENFSGHTDLTMANIMVLLAGVVENEEGEVLGDVYEGGFSAMWKRMGEEGRVKLTKQFLAVSSSHEYDDWWFDGDKVPEVEKKFCNFLGEKGLDSSFFKTIEGSGNDTEPGLIAFNESLEGALKRRKEKGMVDTADLVAIAWFLRAADFMQVYDANYLKKVRVKTEDGEILIPEGPLGLYFESEEIKPGVLKCFWKEPFGEDEVVAPWHTCISELFYMGVVEGEVLQEAWSALDKYYGGEDKNPFRIAERECLEWIKVSKDEEHKKRVRNESKRRLEEARGSVPKEGFYVFKN